MAAGIVTAVVVFDLLVVTAGLLSGLGSVEVSIAALVAIAAGTVVLARRRRRVGGLPC